MTETYEVARPDAGIVQYNHNSLSFIQQPTWEQAEVVVETLLKMSGAIQFWMGDTILMVEGCFPQTYTQLFPDGYKSKSLANMRWVSSRVDPSRRRGELSWSHHEAVGALEPGMQDDLLAEAIIEQWTVSQLRAAVRLAQGKLPAQQKPCPGCQTYRAILTELANPSGDLDWVAGLASRALAEV